MKYLTPSEVSARTGLTIQTITRLCREGKIEGALPPSDSWLIPAGSVRKIPKRGKGRPKNK
jgi:predicted site-specific integrase-resolvase